MSKILYLARHDRDWSTKKIGSAMYHTVTLLVINLTDGTCRVSRSSIDRRAFNEDSWDPDHEVPSWTTFVAEHAITKVVLPVELADWARGSVPALEAILKSFKHRRFFSTGHFSLLCHGDMDRVGSLIEEFCGRYTWAPIKFDREDAARLSRLHVLATQQITLIKAQEALRREREIELAHERSGIMGGPSSSEPCDGRGGVTGVSADDKALDDTAEPATAHPDTRGFCSPDPASASAASGFLSPVYDTALIADEPSKFTTTGAPDMSKVAAPSTIIRQRELGWDRKEAFEMFRRRSRREIDKPILRISLGVAAAILSFQLLCRVLYGTNSSNTPMLGYSFLIGLSALIGLFAGIKGFDKITGCEFQVHRR